MEFELLCDGKAYHLPIVKKKINITNSTLDDLACDADITQLTLCIPRLQSQHSTSLCDGRPWRRRLRLGRALHGGCGRVGPRDGCLSEQ